jgi:methionine-rich copper-binding protein CopC
MMKTGICSRQVAKTPSSEFFLYLPLRLCVFARDIPIFLVAASFPLLAPTVASGHAYLVKSVPAGRATLFNSPGKIQLWFNERLEPKYSYLSVHDPGGKRVDSDNAHVSAEDPKQLSIGVKKLPAGKYTVKFRVLSVDGHVVEQSFPFTIREAKN